MTARVWVCSFNPFAIFSRIGLRQKYRGEPWEEPYKNDEVPMRRTADGETVSSKYEHGLPVAPELFPVASAYYKKKRIPKAQPISMAGFAYIVNEKLAHIMKDFDLGPGGMAPYPIYESDETTPIKDKWWILGLGAQKHTLLPEQCRKIRAIIPKTETYIGLYREYSLEPDELTFSRDALIGPDLWAEKHLVEALLMSDGLGQKIIEAGMGDYFQIRSAIVADRIVADGAAPPAAPPQGTKPAHWLRGLWGKR